MDEDADYYDQLNDPEPNLYCELCADSGLIRISKYTFAHRGPSLGVGNSRNECEVYCTCKTGRMKQRSDQKELEAQIQELIPVTKKPASSLRERIKNAHSA